MEHNWTKLEQKSRLGVSYVCENCAMPAYVSNCEPTVFEQYRTECPGVITYHNWEELKDNYGTIYWRCKGCATWTYKQKTEQEFCINKIVLLPCEKCHIPSKVHRYYYVDSNGWSDKVLLCRECMNDTTNEDLDQFLENKPVFVFNPKSVHPMCDFLEKMNNQKEVKGEQS